MESETSAEAIGKRSLQDGPFDLFDPIRKAIDLIVSDDPLETCLDLILQEACSFTGADHGNILLINETDKSLEIQAFLGYSQSEVEKLRRVKLNLAQGEGISSTAVNEKRYILANDVSAFSQYYPFCDGIRSEIAVPIMYLGSVLGAINLESVNHGTFNEERGHILLLDSLSKLVAAVVEARTKNISDIDSILSGVISDIDATEDKLSLAVVKWVTCRFRVGECSLFLLQPRTGWLSCVASSIGGRLSPLLVGDEYAFGDGLTGWVGEQAKPLVINDLYDKREYQKYVPLPRWENKPARKLTKTDYTRYLGVPIKSNGKVIGVIRISDLYSKRSNAVRNYVYSDQKLLETVSDKFAGALKLVKERSKLKEIYRVSADINSKVSKEDLFNTILHASAQLTEASEAGIYLIVEGNLRLSASTGISSESTGDIVGDESLPGHVASEGRELFGNIKRDSLGVPDRVLKTSSGALVVSELAVPLRLRDEVVGVIHVVSARPDAFNDDDIWSLSVLAEQIVTAVEKSRIIDDLKTKTQTLLELNEKLRESTGAAAASAVTIGNVHGVSKALATAQKQLTTLEKLQYVRQNQQVYEAVQRAIERLEEMAGIFNRSLRFYESMNPEFEMLDPNALIREVEAILYPTTSSRHVALSAILSPDLPKIRADRLLLRVVLINLVLNAVDSSPRTIRLRSGINSSRIAGKLVKVVEISVNDDGHGISDDILTRIFDPFFSTKKRGSGLGLYVSKDIVQKHGGTLHVISTPGRGTTFHIQLPIA